MKKRYEKPVIFKLKTGLTNKFGKSALPYGKRVRKDIDGVPVEELRRRWKLPGRRVTGDGRVLRR